MRFWICTCSFTTNLAVYLAKCVFLGKNSVRENLGLVILKSALDDVLVILQTKRVLLNCLANVLELFANLLLGVTKSLQENGC